MNEQRKAFDEWEDTWADADPWYAEHPGQKIPDWLRQALDKAKADCARLAQKQTTGPLPIRGHEDA